MPATLCGNYGFIPVLSGSVVAAHLSMKIPDPIGHRAFPAVACLGMERAKRNDLESDNRGR